MGNKRQMSKRVLSLLMAVVMVLGTMPMPVFAAEETETVEISHEHGFETVITAPTCTEQGYTTYACECGESYVGDYVEATGHSYRNGICDVCGSHELIVPPSDTDLFVFAGQSNMMGASVLEPEVNTFTDKAWEYKYMPKCEALKRAHLHLRRIRPENGIILIWKQYMVISCMT